MIKKLTSLIALSCLLTSCSNDDIEQLIEPQHYQQYQKTN